MVVYFSNTGNTKKVAEALAQETGGTLYAIEAAQPYTAADLDYNNNDSRSVKEHKDPSIRPAIKGMWLTGVLIRPFILAIPSGGDRLPIFSTPL